MTSYHAEICKQLEECMFDLKEHDNSVGTSTADVERYEYELDFLELLRARGGDSLPRAVRNNLIKDLLGISRNSS